MRSAIFTLVFSFFVHSLAGQFLCGPENCQRPYYLSACAVFQQEARFLKEWIEYHKMMGVEHFYLYNDNSTDEFISVLAPYLESGEVDLFWWPAPVDGDLEPCHVKAIQDAVGRAARSSLWLAILDIEDFIVPTEHRTITDYLADVETAVSQIAVMRRFFGTSGVERVPDDRLMLETLTKREAAAPRERRPVKAIVKPKYVRHAGLQECEMFRSAGKMPHAPSDEPAPPLLLHHYWSKDIAYLKAVKKQRLERGLGFSFRDEEIEDLACSYNDVDDPIMERFTAELRDRVFPKNQEDL